MSQKKRDQKFFPLLHHGKNLLVVNATVDGTNGNVGEDRVRLLGDTGSSLTILPIKPWVWIFFDLVDRLSASKLIWG